MNNELFEHYMSLKLESYEGKYGYEVGDWFRQFLESSPTEDQFKKIIDDINMTKEFWWAIWSAKK